MGDTARKRLAKRIRLLRTNRGWSQEVLAELSGLNRSYIGAVERAEHNIGLDNIERIALALELSVQALLEDHDHRQQPPVSSNHTQSTQAMSISVEIHRRTFMELLNQCGQQHRELVLIYLQRCGVTVLD